MALTWIVLLVLVLFSSFLSGSETAISAVGRAKAEVFLEQGRRGATSLAMLLKNPNRLLSTFLVGHDIAKVTAVAIATSVAITLLGKAGVAVAAAAVAMLLALLLLVEIIPKSYAARYSDRVALSVATPIYLLEVVLTPVTALFTWVNRSVLQLMGSKTGAGMIVTEEEIRSLISIGHQQGVLEPEEEEILNSVFEFTDTVASEVMTPRLDMPAVSITTSVDAAAELLLERALSRLGAYENTPDNIIGVIHIEDVLKAKVEGDAEPVQALVRPALVVPESKPVGNLLERMRKERVSAALVADEYGSVSGIITLEDLVEHIVGDLWDEHDPEDDRIKAVDESSSIIDGRLSIDEISEALDVHIPTEHAHTVGGWMFHVLGRLPNVGDVVEWEGVEFRVQSMDRWRVDRVQVKKMVVAASGSTTLGTDD